VTLARDATAISRARACLILTWRGTVGGNQSGITREEFASAVVAAISSVHHVYRALDRLLLELRQSLAEPPTPLTHVPGTFGKFGRDPGRLVVRHEYGTHFWAVSDADEVEEDEEEEDGDDGDPEPTRKTMRTTSPNTSMFRHRSRPTSR
jgi:hypothetical protein